MRINYKNVNTCKLHDELIFVGILPLIVESLNNDTWITYADDVNMATVENIVAVHSPVPLPQAPSIDERVTTLEPRVTTVEDVVLELLLMP